MIKHCARCGKEFEIIDSSRNSQKYCSRDCYNAVSREKDKERKLKLKKAQNKINPPKPTERKRCKRYSCLYHPRKEAPNGCDYTLITGKLRGGEPGQGCTCYKRGSAKERQRMQIENAKNGYWGW